MTVCIYCCQDSTSSIGVPHIALEAIMENDLVLPIGAECDECNNYFGSLQTAFLHHNRIHTPIMRYGIPGKKGRRRKRLGHFEAKEDRITLTYRKEWLKATDGKIIIYIPDPPEFNDFRFRRELYHIAFNYLAWKLGIDEVLKQKYDAVRKYIRYASYNEKWHYAQVGFPDNEVRTNLSISLVEDAPELVVRFVSYIDDFYMDIFQTDYFKDWVKDTLPKALLHTKHNI